MPTIKIIIFLLGFSNISYSSMNWGGYHAKTPLGNSISNYYAFHNMLILKNGVKLDSLREWWFYEGHIIGKFEKETAKKNTEIMYFVVNEATFKMDVFSAEKQLQKYLNQQALEPKIWKRKYTGDWVFFDETMILFLFLGFFISVPLAFIYLFMVINLITKEKFSLKKPYTIIVMGIAFLVFVAWLSEQFPQSI